MARSPFLHWHINPLTFKPFLMTSTNSQRQMSAGEAQDYQRRGYLVGNAVAWVRELCRGTQDLSVEIQRGKYQRNDIERFAWFSLDDHGATFAHFFLFLFAPNKTAKKQPSSRTKNLVSFLEMYVNPFLPLPSRLPLLPILLLKKTSIDHQD